MGKWLATRFEKDSVNIRVQPMEGIWKIPFKDLIEVCKSAPIHTYGQRVYDNKGNARDSYVLNLNNPKFLRIL